MEVLQEAELCFPQLLNASCRRPARAVLEVVLASVLLCCVSLLTAALNLLLVVSIAHFRRLQTPTNLLLLSLAVSDLLVGLLMFFQILLMDGCWYLGDVMCTLYNVVDYIVTSASVGTMVLISADRYVAVCDPLHYPSRVTVGRVTLCVCLCWICSISYNSLIMRQNLLQPGRYRSCSGECVVAVDYAAGVADLLFTFLGPVAVIIVLYLRVFAVAVSQARAMRSQVAAVQGPEKAAAQRSELKAARTLGVVVVVFLLCLCPYFSVTLADQDSLLNASSAAFVICLFYFNSCLNPLIYALFYPWFRKSIRLIVTLQILQPDSSEVHM